MERRNAGGGVGECEGLEERGAGERATTLLYTLRYYYYTASTLIYTVVLVLHCRLLLYFTLSATTTTLLLYTLRYSYYTATT